MKMIEPFAVFIEKCVVIVVAQGIVLLMLTAHLPRINTIRDDQMKELAEYFGVSYRKNFLNL